MTVRPAPIHIPQSSLLDLHQRLRSVRWSDIEPVSDWTQGIPMSTMRRLVDIWLTDYDWRTYETQINSLNPTVATIGDIDVHFLHVRSPEPGSLAVILTNGWPGTAADFRDVLRPLADPVRHGGTPRDAVHVVAPSIPGFGFSASPTTTSWDPRRVAHAWAELMRQLGYSQRWVAHGQDIGLLVTQELARMNPPGLVGIHTTGFDHHPTSHEIAEATAEERSYMAKNERFSSDGFAYARLQSTRPQTLGYALTDSPTGQLAWIAEKYHEWGDHELTRDFSISDTALLDIATTYWLTRTATTSARMYWEIAHATPSIDPITMPTAMTVYPRDNIGISYRWAQNDYPTLTYWASPDHGGHFPALETPSVFVHDLRAAIHALTH